MPAFFQYLAKEAPSANNGAMKLLDAADMRSPAKWYPQARAMDRRLIMHVGPTNSGKTHNAMESLKKAKTGLYCGPLRLLANEIFERLNGEGIPCDLLTGEERKTVPNARIVSCTVEMTSMTNKYDIAIIDEIQMMGDPQRGWAWTQALLGK